MNRTLYFIILFGLQTSPDIVSGILGSVIHCIYFNYTQDYVESLDSLICSMDETVLFVTTKCISTM